jgi:hypothetical protein
MRTILNEILVILISCMYFGILFILQRAEDGKFRFKRDIIKITPINRQR